MTTKQNEARSQSPLTKRTTSLYKGDALLDEVDLDYVVGGVKMYSKVGGFIKQR